MRMRWLWHVNLHSRDKIDIGHVSWTQLALNSLVAGKVVVVTNLFGLSNMEIIILYFQ